MHAGQEKQSLPSTSLFIPERQGRLQGENQESYLKGGKPKFGAKRRGRPTATLATCTPLLKCHGHKSRGLIADVRQRVGVAAGEPLDVSVFEMYRQRPLVFDVATQFEIAHRHEKVRAVVMMARNGSTGLDLDLGDTRAVTDRQDFDVYAWKVLVPGSRGPGSWSITKLLVLEDLDGDVAERLIREIVRDVREVAGSESGFAIRERQVDRGLAGDFVGDAGVSERDKEVVVAVTMTESRGG